MNILSGIWKVSSASKHHGTNSQRRKQKNTRHSLTCFRNIQTYFNRNIDLSVFQFAQEYGNVLDRISKTIDNKIWYTTLKLVPFLEKSFRRKITKDKFASSKTQKVKRLSAKYLSTPYSTSNWKFSLFKRTQKNQQMQH